MNSKRVTVVGIVACVLIACIGIVLVASTALAGNSSDTTPSNESAQEAPANADASADAASSDSEEPASASDDSASAGQAPSGGDQPVSSDTGAYSPLSSQSDGGASSSSTGNGSSASNQGSTSQGSQGAAQSPASTCTISIDCQAALDNRDQLSSGILQSLPSNGVILAASSIELAEGESAFDVLKNACEKAGITLDYTGGFLGSSVYVRSIGPIGEFDYGPQSGWTYTVNGQMVFTSASDYMIQPGDTLSWSYTCSA